ncbi:MAG: GldG family protein [Chloroflexi bacterium]|nr:GldG family protein [Chloroflexota bacterium]
MDSKWRRFAPAGLVIAALALITAIVLGLIKGVQGLGLYTPSNPDQLTLALQISAAVFVLGLAMYAMLEPDRVRAFFTGRQARYGSNALVMALAFVGILVVVNYLAFQNPKSWDLTEGREHTLAPETLDILAALPENVTAVAFYSARTPTDRADKLLLDFKSNSDGKFDYRFMDPDLNPVAAREAGITGDGKILLQMGDRQEIATFASEQELARAMIRLISPDERVVYFLTGHGERDLEQQGDASVTRVKATLAGKNYTVRTLSLRAENQIPEDALAVIIVGPIEAISAEEVALLDAYLSQGGALVLMQDPSLLTDIDVSADPLADYLAETWGITLDDDLVVDPSVNPPSNAVSYRYGEHPVTTKMNNVLAFFPFARSLQITDVDGVTQTPLVFTIDRAWGETDFTGLQEGDNQLQFNEGQDIPGPLVLAVAAENPTTKGRVVVFGNSEFVADSSFDAYGNGDLAINAIDWAAEQEDLLKLTPKDSVERTFRVPGDLQLVAILLGTICLLPGAVLVGGVVSWVSRRRRG